MALGKKDDLHMDALPDGSTLLVGEGDFSFSVAMTTQCPPHYLRSILATSYETPESIKKHVPAEENMATLAKKGVDVRLSTDATQLHTDPYFTEKRFSRIIFNFPHIGGKSNLKRNRKLLNDFFASASQILEPRGHIMVTLCKGQGGTAADKPMRKWHDSWQVVSMAANSGFILVKVLPFHQDRYKVYTSTGFRSQDKGFHTDNAVTHVFERAECVPVPVKVEDVQVGVKDTSVTCPTYLYQKLQQIRRIKVQQHNPVHHLYKHIVSKFSKLIVSESWAVPIMTIRDKGFQKCMLVLTSQQSDIEVNDDVYKLQVCGNMNTIAVHYADSSTVANDVCTKKIYDDDIKHGDDYSDVLFTPRQNPDDIGSKHYHLASSLTEGLELISDTSTENDCVIAYGVVFKRVHLSPANMPPSFNVLITCPVSHDLINKGDIPEGSNLVQSHDQVEISGDNRLIENLLKCAFKQVTRMVEMLGTLVSLHDKTSEMKLVKQNQRQREYRFGAVHTLGRISCTRFIDGTQETVDVGEASLAEFNIGTQNVWKTMVELGLSKLTCLMYKVSSEKLLWSNDYRVIREFERLLHLQEQDLLSGREYETIEDNSEQNDEAALSKGTSNRLKIENDNNSKISINLGCEETCSITQGLQLKQTSNQHFVATSVYPLTSIHDMSFWENESIPFDETMFQDIIRSIVGDEIIFAELIDVFTDSATCRKSRCYRLTFASVDKCLSYDCSWKLQSLIRLEVERLMKITLR